MRHNSEDDDNCVDDLLWTIAVTVLLMMAFGWWR